MQWTHASGKGNGAHMKNNRAVLVLVIAGIFVCICTAAFGTAGFVAWRIADDAEQQSDASAATSELEADQRQDTDEEMAPEFSATDLDGHTWTLDGLEGRPVVINFWATWCPPCREELPVLQKLSDEYAEDDLVILLVDVQESKELVRDYLAARNVTLPCVLDEDGRLSRLYRVNSFPTNVLIRPDGTIDGRIVGWQGEDHLRRGIEFILR